MTDVVDLYGITDSDMDAVATFLTQTLGRTFESHESSHWGNYYLAHSEDWEEEISLKENFNSVEQNWSYPEYQQYPLTLEVSASMEHAREAKELLKKAFGARIVLLTHEEYD